MNMDEIGYNHRHEREFHVERPEGTGDWLMLIIKSPVILRVGEEEIKSPAGTLMIYQPGVPQFYRPDCDEYFDDWIHFLPDDTDIALIHELGLPLNTPAKLTEYTEVSSIVDRMCYEQYSANAYRKETVQLYFRLLLYKLSEKINRGNVPGGDHPKAYVEKLHWIRESIYRWPSREYTVDDMAKDLSLSRSRFQHLYSETFDTSVSKDIINSRLSRTAELLTTTDLPVKDIALLVGYGNNSSYLVRLFKSIYGISPGQYRKTNTQK